MTESCVPCGTKETTNGKKYLTDTLDLENVQVLAGEMKATKFLDWFTYSDNTIDQQNP